MVQCYNVLLHFIWMNLCLLPLYRGTIPPHTSVCGSNVTFGAIYLWCNWLKWFCVYCFSINGNICRPTHSVNLWQKCYVTVFQCAVTFNLNEFVFLAPLWGACPCIQVNLWQKMLHFCVIMWIAPPPGPSPDTLRKSMYQMCQREGVHFSTEHIWSRTMQQSKKWFTSPPVSGIISVKLNTSEEVELCPKITQAAWIQMHQSRSTLGRNLKYDLIYNGMLENEMCSSVWMMVPIGHTNLMPVRRVV